MNISDKALALALESLVKRINLVVPEVESMAQRMRQVERWQATMDMTLKAMQENN